MIDLEKKLENLSVENAIKIEESDRQFIALKNMLLNTQKNRNLYLSMILVNSLVCYQLSSSGEKYWEEFSEEASRYLNDLDTENGKSSYFILDFFDKFLPRSKGNKRFINIKMRRVEKIVLFLDNFLGKELFFYENMIVLRDLLYKKMEQKSTAKTIVFAVKMFGYGARIYFDKMINYPFEISIPIDSRLTNLYEKYKGDYKNIDIFYDELSKKTKIAPLHLDAILWVNYDDFMK